MPFFLFLVLTATVLWVYFIPVKIARARDIPERPRFFVFWLNVFGFLGLPWLAAFVLACSRYPRQEKDRSLEITVKQSRADQLVKLSELKKDGFLTEEEFEKEKALLM